MNRNRSIIVLGFLIALMPFLGFPLKFKEFILIVFGLGIAYIGFRIKKSQKHLKNTRTDIFMDGKREEDTEPEAETYTKHLLNAEEKIG